MPDPSSREHQKEDWKAHKKVCGEKGASAPDPTVTAGGVSQPAAFRVAEMTAAAAANGGVLTAEAAVRVMMGLSDAAAPTGAGGGAGRGGVGATGVGQMTALGAALANGGAVTADMVAGARMGSDDEAAPTGAAGGRGREGASAPDPTVTAGGRSTVMGVSALRAALANGGVVTAEMVGAAMMGPDHEATPTGAAGGGGRAGVGATVVRPDGGYYSPCHWLPFIIRDDESKCIR